MHDSWLLLSCSTDIFFGDREALNSPHASELLTPAEMEAAGEEKESILLRDGRINKAAPAISRCRTQYPPTPLRLHYTTAKYRRE